MKTIKKIIILTFMACAALVTLPWSLNKVSAASYESAWFPAPVMRITQLAYESYSHGQCNAIDISPGGTVFAPFSGIVKGMDKNWGYVLFQSSDMVYYADGSLDYMTVAFMHDSDISNLYVGKTISQGEDFYHAGGMGAGKANAYASHVDISIFRGKVDKLPVKYGRGDTYAYDAFFVNSDKTASITNMGKCERGNKMYNNAPADWSSLWRYLTDSTTNPSAPSTPAAYATISEYSTPTSLCVGQIFSIKGKIASDSIIKEVHVVVYTADGSYVMGKTALPNSKSYSLTSIDPYIYFNKLSAGSYLYQVSATNAAGNVLLVSANFTVVGNYATISDYNTPSNIEAGKVFSIKGRISSATNLTEVHVCIYKADGSYVMGKTALPNAKSYNLTAIDKYLYFNKLPVGNYLYHVSATNGAGNKLLVSALFKVSDKSNAQKCTIMPACAPNTRLDVLGGSKENRANIQIYEANGTLAQKFELKPLANNYYAIINVGSGKALDVAGGENKSGTNVWQYDYNGTDAQQWSFIDAGDGYYYIVSKINRNLALDVSSGGDSNGLNIQVYTKNNSNAQRFKLFAAN